MGENNAHRREFRQPERYPVERAVKKSLERSVRTVDNVLTALTHTGREGYLRDIRVEELEKLHRPVFEYIEYGDREAANALIEALTRLMQAQKAVVDSHHTQMQEIGLQEIIDRLREIYDSGFDHQVSMPIAKAYDAQDQTIKQLELLNSMLLSNDEPITQRVIGIKTGVDMAFAQGSSIPLRFIERGLDTLIADAIAVDEQMTNMPEKNQEWKNAQAENNKLRQLLTQFIS